MSVCGIDVSSVNLGNYVLVAGGDSSSSREQRKAERQIEAKRAVKGPMKLGMRKT